MKRPKLLALGAASALLLAACSPGSDNDDKNGGGGDTGSNGESSVVTFRLWDETAVPAYEESFAKFTEQNPDIKVEIELVDWGQYWERLPRDISTGDMADIFWVNSNSFGLYADNGDLLSITDELGDDHDEWEESVVNLYTREDHLWGVPQIWDSVALFYNKEMVEEAGIDPSDLTWAPDAGEGDTLLAAARALTTDADGNTADSADFDPNNIKTFGFNAMADLQAIYVDFLAQAGAQFQDEDDMFAFDSAEGVDAFQYLVDMIHEHHVAPPASETNLNGDYARELFVRGELGLFQSGPYSLSHISDGAEFDWGIAPIVGGPEGKISVVHGVVAVGNADTENKEATVEVLRWLGSAEGQEPLATHGIAFPGAVDAQAAYVDYWAKEGVDVSVFIDSAQEPTAPAPIGPNSAAGLGAIDPIIKDIFLGATPVDDGLAQAQEEGNAAME